MRQGANSAIRFTTYATLKQFVQSTSRPGQPLPSAITFGIGGIAGLVTVYTTMPLECVLHNSFHSGCRPNETVIALSKPVCNLWRLAHNTGILSTVRIAFSRKRVYFGFGLARRPAWLDWW